MPTQPIIQYQGGKEDQSDKLAKVIMMEKLGQGIAGASDMLNKGIESYQKIKANKQAQELSAIQAAGVLVGGPDRLPVETRNKLPGILGIDLPRDEKGDVVLTPSAQAVIDRATAELAQKDPEAFARVKSGMQTAAPSPEEVALKLETEKTARQGKILDFQKAEADRKQQAADKAADRADAEEANIRTTNATVRAAEIRGSTGAAARVAKMDEPSDYWIDKRPGPTEGNQLSRPAAEMTLEPGQKLEDVYWNPSHKALEEHNVGRRAKAQADRARSNTEVDQARKALIEARVKQAGAKDPEGTKFIMDGLIEARKLLKVGAPNAQKIYDYYFNEWVTKIGKEAPPQDYGWMSQMVDYAIEKGSAWLEVKSGRGSTGNVLTTKPGVGAATAAPVPGSATGEPDAELEALMNKHRKPAK